MSLTVFTDVDHAGCKVTRKSTNGLCVFLGCNLLVWGSRKQSMVARSIVEAEYRVVAQGVTKILWLKSLLLELGYPCEKIPILWCDNLAAKSMAENPVFHSRTKHIEIDVHFVREKIENKDVEVRYVPTLHQVADIFTKGLSRDRFLFLSHKLRLQQSPMNSIQPVVCADAKIQLLSTTAADGSTSSALPRELDLRGNVEE